MKIPEVITKLVHQRWVMLAALLLLVGLIYVMAQKILGPKVAVQVVAMEDVVQTIVASGHVEAPRRVDIGSQITGTVASIPVAEGQSVKAQQILVKLEDSEAKALVAQAKAAVAQAEARLRQISELGLPTAEQALNQAQFNRANVAKQWARTKELQNKGFLGQAALDDAQKNLDIADSQTRTARLQVDTNRKTGSDYLVATTALAQAEASLNMTLAKLNYTTIEAPVAGILIARNVERGDVVQPGKALMVLSPGGDTQLVVKIDERNLAGLRLGEQALAAADAFPNQRFSAEIAYINPAVDVLRGSVEVKLNVPAPPAYLRQDMTVSVDIEVARRARVLVLATDAIHDSASAAPWAMKIVDGHAKRIPIKIGVRGGDKVEILDGLVAGDQIIKTIVATAIEGTRVRGQMKESAKSATNTTTATSADNTAKK